MNLSRGLSIVSLTLLIVFATTSVFAGVPLVTSYQGRLLDGSDQPLTGSYTMIFQIYEVPVGGAPLWTEDHVGVQVTDGLFSVALGATVPLSADLLTGGGGGGGGVVRYLQIQIAGQPPISPRTPLSAAPYAVASSSVSGDVVTAPGALHMFDADSAATIDMGTEIIAGKKVAKFKAGSELAGTVNKREVAISADADSASIAIDESEVHVARMAADNESTYTELSGKRPGRPQYGDITLKANGDESRVLMVTDVDGDGAPESSVMSSSSATSAKHAINTKGTGSAGRTVRSTTDSTVAASSVEADLDGDGLADNSVASSADATSAKMAINVKGTGSTSRSATLTVSGTPGGSASAACATDVDNDGVPESSVSSSADDVSARMAINTKGTGSNFKSASLTVQASPGGNVSAACATDVDDDGIPNEEITQVCTPTTSGVAIKTKGTGADKDRVVSVSSGTADSTGVVACDVDDDGDGISEFKAQVRVTDEDGDVGSDMRCVADTDDDGVADNEASLRVTPTTSGVAIKTKGTGADANRKENIDLRTSLGSASAVLDIDDDGDSVPESEISQILTPTTSGVAIKTKGTGANDNRAASLVCAADLDGDGTVDRSVSTTADSTTAGIAIDEPGVQIAMKVVNHGVVKGNIIVNNGNRMIDLDSDGDGFFDHGIGVGVDATHRIDVAGGAYCDGTNWVNASDANVKENFQPVNGSELLDQIEQLAISRWNYKGNADMAHIGPTAQDFQAIFGVGSDGKSISTIDPAGIALAAAKELRIELKDKTQQLNELQNKVQQLQALVERLLAEKK
ncbi:MAG: tail fiber domain-containing protein [candidate division Zixibacteria bacterium]|nr:tail fiber domain-containing protein [candidate division Zixibacteria bacterium]